MIILFQSKGIIINKMLLPPFIVISRNIQIYTLLVFTIILQIIGISTPVNAQLKSTLLRSNEIEVNGGPSLVTLLNDTINQKKRLINKIEIFVGPSLSSLRGNPGVDNGSQNSRKIKVGYSFGAGLTYSLRKKIDVTGQLLYERKGGKSETITTYFDEETQTFMNGRADSDYSYDYFTLPIVFRYGLGKRNKIKCGLGPYISYLHKQTLTVNNYFHNGSNSSYSDQTELNSKFDLGFSGEILYSIPLSSRIALNLQLNHKTGLKNVRPMVSNPYSMKTNNTSFLIGIIINR